MIAARPAERQQAAIRAICHDKPSELFFIAAKTGNARNHRSWNQPNQYHAVFRRNSPLAIAAPLEWKRQAICTALMISSCNRMRKNIVDSQSETFSRVRIPIDIRLPKTMDTHQHHALVRQFGAAAIEERLTDVALLMRTAFPQCVWHLGQDPDSREMQQLEIGFSGARTALYFTNEELCAYSGEKRRCDTDHRLHRALSKLLDDQAASEMTAH